MKTKKIVGTPVGIIILMIWQVLVAAFSIINLIALKGVIDLGGTMFGISDPEILKMFFWTTVFINIIALIAIFQGLNWGRWVYIVSLITLILLKISNSIFIIYTKGINYFFNVTVNSSELIIMIINIFIICYLVKSKKVKMYFRL